ncbi:MAG: PLP-dependent aspartate aminotransferase family protein [Pseudomonadota bacterium]
MTSPKTRYVHIARDHTDAPRKSVNPPIVRASTVLYDNVATMVETRDLDAAGERVFRYGARGTPTSFALEEAITDVEGGAGTLLFPTGLAAVAHPFLSILRPGDHVLFAETVYGPARALATEYLPQRGITCEFYPGGHEQVAALIQDRTRMVYLDNPGSIVFDIQDVPAIRAAISDRDIALVVDNTWGCPGLYRPILLGADISVVAITKYVAGHSDVMMGSVTSNARYLKQLREDCDLLGQTVSPEDAYLALRGLRTAEARLAMHQVHTNKVADWLAAHPKIAEVLYPPREGDRHHSLFERDFAAGNGLLSVAFAPGVSQESVNRFVDGLKLFGLGASWGGFESLALVYGKVPGWDGGRIARLHIGLEEPDDLIADLAQSLDKVDV